MLPIALALLTTSAEPSWAKGLDARLPDLVRTYEELHKKPELSYQEKATAAFIAKRLRALGYKVTERVGKYSRTGSVAHGVVGVMENGPGPRLLLRTDLDGLPMVENTGLPYASKVTTKNEAGQEVGVMHGCGHDLHMTAFLGTAALLAERKSEWRGTLVLLGQPAEEVGAGARAMLEDGLYERFGRPDFALALHVEGENEAGLITHAAGYNTANVDSVDITVRGVGGHGAYPHKTKDPVVIASQLVIALQTLVSRETRPLDPAVITVGSIHGGTKHNIISDEVKLQLTVRTYKPEVRTALLQGIERVARGVASAAGVPEDRMPIVSHDQYETTPAGYNSPALLQRLLPVWREALGADRVRDREPVMGGEDFARYSLADLSVPSVMFFVGTTSRARLDDLATRGRAPIGTHSAQYAPDAAPSLRSAILAMTSAALELLKR